MKQLTMSKMGEGTPDESGTKKTLRWNKETLKAGLKGIAVTGAGMAAAVPAHYATRWVLNELGVPKNLTANQVAQVGGALALAVPAMLGANRLLNRRYVEDAYERSQQQPTAGLRIPEGPAGLR
jgi:hypothetical protein